MINFINTASRKKEAFVALKPPIVTMYTCGPTVYNFAHIGNFRAIIAYDLVKRWLTIRGFEVKHVMNITDVDDKTIKGAIAQKLSLAEFTKKYTDEFFSDCAKIRIIKPNLTPAATDNIDGMVDLVATLVEKGMAYSAEDGSVYFAINKFAEYGKLSNLKLDDLKQGARIDHDEYDKENVSDFVLWKGWTAADGDVKWDSPWGAGRPGWHLECSVMAQRFLGDTIDIHMGGEDLVFPHHENEVAQSEAATGKPFAKYWLHNGYLLVDGKKMSKSAGNFFTLRDIMEKGYTGREIRYHLLCTHYRQQFNFTLEGLHAARSALQRLDDLRQKLEKLIKNESDATLKAEIKETLATAQENWNAKLDDDLNVSPALAILFDLVRQANVWCDDNKVNAAEAELILEFIDYTDRFLDVACEEEKFPEEAYALMAQRTIARTEKNWAQADLIRDQLKALDLTVEDTADGPRLKRI